MKVHLEQNVFGVWTPKIGQTRNFAQNGTKEDYPANTGSRVKPQNPDKTLR